MRIVLFGDVVGRSGRDALKAHLPTIQADLRPDLIIVNAENAAHGFGLTPSIAKELFDLGIHCLTLGNHSFDKIEIVPRLGQTPPILRPINYTDGTPGLGMSVIQTAKGSALIIHAMGRLFMELSDDPFKAVDQVLKRHTLGQTVQAIILDFHAEATSEKMAMGFFCDGRVSAVVGTHTHVPTADLQILPKGTLYQTDLGMCGDYCSVVGMESKGALRRFLQKIPKDKLEPASKEGSVCGVFLETNSNGFAKTLHPIRLGGVLLEQTPLPFPFPLNPKKV